MYSRRHFAKFAAAFALTAPIAAFANQPVHFVGDVTVFHDAPAAKTRAQVTQELEAFRENPVAADGYRWVGGERGWAPPAAHSYDIAAGRIVHSDRIPHNGAKPSRSSTDVEKQRAQEIYRGG